MQTLSRLIREDVGALAGANSLLAVAPVVGGVEVTVVGLEHLA
jgi:hypothetical protein